MSGEMSETERELRVCQSHQIRMRVWPWVKERGNKGWMEIPKSVEKVKGSSMENLARLWGSPWAKVTCQRNPMSARREPALDSLLCWVIAWEDWEDWEVWEVIASRKSGLGIMAWCILMGVRASRSLGSLVSYISCCWKFERPILTAATAYDSFRSWFRKHASSMQQMGMFSRF